MRSSVCLDSATRSLVDARADRLTFYVDLSDGTRPVQRRTLSYEPASRTIIEKRLPGRGHPAASRPPDDVAGPAPERLAATASTRCSATTRTRPRCRRRRTRCASARRSRCRPSSAPTRIAIAIATEILRREGPTRTPFTRARTACSSAPRTQQAQPDPSAAHEPPDPPPPAREDGMTMIVVMIVMLVATVVSSAALIAAAVRPAVLRRLDGAQAGVRRRRGRRWSTTSSSSRRTTTTGRSARRARAARRPPGQPALGRRRARPAQVAHADRAPRRRTRSSCCPRRARPSASPGSAETTMLDQAPAPSGSGAPAARATPSGRSSTSFRRTSFLDFLYFTDFETLDPDAYTGTSGTDSPGWATANCRNWRPYRDASCQNIQFVSRRRQQRPVPHERLDPARAATTRSADQGGPRSRSRSPRASSTRARAARATPASPNIKGTKFSPADTLTMPTTNATLRDAAHQGRHRLHGHDDRSSSRAT